MSKGGSWRPTEIQLRNLRQHQIPTRSIKHLISVFRELLDFNPTVKESDFIRFALSLGTAPLSKAERAADTHNTARTPHSSGCIPEDWMPSDETVTRLIELGMPEYRIREEAIAFRTYWLTRKESRQNWDASFISRLYHLQRQAAGHGQTVEPARSTRCRSLQEDLTDTSWAN